MQYKKTTAILLAVLAAAFYAVNVPVSKLLLKEISPTFLASLLYFGAGIGIGLLYCINPKSHRGEKKLTRKDLPYTLGMILLDIAAPILLMLGLKSASFPDWVRFSLLCASESRSPDCTLLLRHCFWDLLPTG